MFQRRIVTLLAVGLLHVPRTTFAAVPDEENPWFVRLGIVDAIYDSGATIASNGQVIPGSTAHVTNNVTLTFDLGYDITENLSVMLMLGVPPKPSVEGRGTIEPLGRLGKVRYGPVILTGTYRFKAGDLVQPYFGLGVAYAVILRDFDASVSELHVHNNWGFVLQAGAEYQVSRNWSLFFDYKRLWLAVNAKGFIGDATPIRARVKLDPTLVSAGVKYRFH
jgi:outer membrane protein